VQADRLYYTVREVLLKTVQLMIDLEANFDIADTKNQRPIYYAIQQGRFKISNSKSPAD